MKEDAEWKAIEAGYEEDQSEIDADGEKIDKLLEWQDVFCDLESALKVFNSNMRSLSRAISTEIQQEKQEGDFLSGTLLVGVVSAYEGFIQSLFKLLCNNSKFMKMAIGNVRNLEKKDLKQLRLSKNKEYSEKDLKGKIKKATLHDPLQVSRLSLVFFHLKFPSLNQKNIEKLLKQRNLFTHHGGTSGGQQEKIDPKYIRDISNNINSLINSYVKNIKKALDDEIG